ncbi:MAG: hypothetical protein CL912_14585 [Deltaproteobacteria bacterium]|nr:hypothetical protein [Deltaproteobacteria bacterium]
MQVLAAPSTIRIKFKIDERGIWRIVRSLLINISNPSKIKRVAKKYMKKGIQPFDNLSNVLIPRIYFQVIIINESNTIFLILENSIKIKN